MPQNIVTPLTDISKGGAQVFSIGGIAEKAQAQAKKKEDDWDKVLSDSLTFNPEGMWDNDISPYQTAMDDYMGFLQKNEEKLARKSENLEVWREKQKREAEIKSYVALSKQHNQQFLAFNNMIINSPDRYDNPQNKSYAVELSEKGLSWEDFKNGVMHDNILQNAKKNLKVDMWAQARPIYERLAKQNVEMGLAGIEDLMQKGMAEGKSIGAMLQKFKSSEDINFDEEEVKDALWVEFRNAESTNPDLAELYYDRGETKQDQFEAYYNDIMSLVPEGRRKTSEEERIASTGSTSVTQRDIDAKNFVSLKEGSGQTFVETVYGDRDKHGEQYAIEEVDEDGKAVEVTRRYGVGTYTTLVDEKGGVSVSTNASKVLQFNEKLIITKNVSRGYQLQNGKMLRAGEGASIKTQLVLEVGNYAVANEDIPIKTTDGWVKFEAGSNLPDIEKMRDEGMITDNHYETIIAKSTSMKGAVVFASTEDLNFFQSAEGDIATFIKQSGAGGQFMVVPYADIADELEGQLRKETATPDNQSGYGINDYYEMAGIKEDYNLFEGFKATK